MVALQHAVTIQLRSQSLPMLQAQITAMSCTPSLCTQKALFIVDTALLFQTQEHIIKKEGGRACNYIVL